MYLINFKKTKLSQLSKVIMFQLNHETDEIFFRNYHVKTQPANINRQIKQILTSNKMPDLRDYNDISDFILRNQTIDTKTELEHIDN